jgi:hypothetical protein
MSGKSVKEIPVAVQEFMIAAVTGWSLEYIRELSEEDFENVMNMSISKITFECMPQVKMF